MNASFILFIQEMLLKRAGQGAEAVMAKATDLPLRRSGGASVDITNY
jgi:hypothetical protein